MSEMSESYISKKPCGCLAFAGVICEETAKDNAKAIKECVKRGYTINTVPTEEVRKMEWTCEEHRVKS